MPGWLIAAVHSTLFKDILFSVAGAAAADYDAFRNFHSWKDFGSFDWPTALFRWFQGVVVGTVGYLMGAIPAMAALVIVALVPKKALLIALGSTLAALTLASCLHHVNASPQTVVADYGTHVLQSVRAISGGLADANAQGAISDDLTAQAMIFGNKAGQAGQKLSALLAAYDTGSAAVKASMLSDIDTQIDAVTNAVDNIVAIAPIPQQFKAQADTIAGLVDNVLKTLTSLRTALHPQTPQPALAPGA